MFGQVQQDEEGEWGHDVALGYWNSQRSSEARTIRAIFWGKHLYFRAFNHAVLWLILVWNKARFLEAQRSSSSDQHCRHSSKPCSWRESYIWCLTLWYLFMKKRLICVTPPVLLLICGSCTSQLLSPSFSLLCFLRCHFLFCPTLSPFTDFYFVQIYILKNIVL